MYVLPRELAVTAFELHIWKKIEREVRRHGLLRWIVLLPRRSLWKRSSFYCGWGWRPLLCCSNGQVVCGRLYRIDYVADDEKSIEAMFEGLLS